jgi:mevalonate kinase
MAVAIASSPGKVILFGEHGVHRQQPNITTTVNMHTFCKVTTRADSGYSFRSGARYEAGAQDQLDQFKQHVDGLRRAKALDDIAALVRRDFYAPARYVLSHLVTRLDGRGLDIEWYSHMPIGSGLGTGAAASTSMVRAAFAAFDQAVSPEDMIFLAWQGDAIAHGGYGSSLDSSTCVLGGYIVYNLDAEKKATRLPFDVFLPIVIGDTLVEHRTNEVNTHIRKWLAENPTRLHVFRDMGYLREPFLQALENADFEALGHVMNLHQLLQVKMGTSIPESDRLIEAALGAGAYGAKISGSGGGGIIIAVVAPEKQKGVAEAIDAAGGRSYIVNAGIPGTRLVTPDVWEAAVRSE